MFEYVIIIACLFPLKKLDSFEKKLLGSFELHKFKGALDIQYNRSGQEVNNYEMPLKCRVVRLFKVMYFVTEHNSKLLGAAVCDTYVQM